MKLRSVLTVTKQSKMFTFENKSELISPEIVSRMKNGDILHVYDEDGYSRQYTIFPESNTYVKEDDGGGSLDSLLEVVARSRKGFTVDLERTVTSIMD